jgi:hypothetical protein
MSERAGSIAYIARKTWDCGANALATCIGGTSSGEATCRKPNEVWGMDFVADQLADGRKIER